MAHGEGRFVGERIDVEALLDRQKLSGFTLRVLALCLLALIIDGYDVQVMSFAAPSLMKAWHVPRSEFAVVFSASLFGILFGAPLFGWIGDRLGRKACILISSVAYGLCSLSLLLAHDIHTLTLLRFLTGVGMGGVFPNAIAIAAELAPRKMRAGMASVISTGITVGGVIPGLVVSGLTFTSDSVAWRTLFLIGGLAPLALAALMAAGLPESIAFLVQRGGSKARIASLARQIDPGLQAGPDDEFVLPSRPAGERVGISALFAGRMALITPLLWLMFASTLLSIFMLTSWMPLLLEASGFPARQAAETNSLFQVGGTLGGIAVGLLLGRFGARMVPVLFLLCLVSIAAVARAQLPPAALQAMIAAAGFSLIGAQASLNGTTGLAYPTAARARGLGMALGVGRVGSVIGPLIAGAMVSAGITSARDLFLLPILPLALGAVAAFIVAARLDLNEAAGSRA
jgi:AAHS family 4-hydroxybenzoate transporter-like MFS transporter